MAQAELESWECPDVYHRVAPHGTDGPVSTETTRPELLPNVCALTAHPGDEHYQHLFRTTVMSSVFGAEIPILTHIAAESGRGVGTVMCCTFGNLTDAQWWREPDLSTHTIIGHDDRLQREFPEWFTNAKPWVDPIDKMVFSARATAVGLLHVSGNLNGESKSIPQPVSFYEEGDRSLEIAATRQRYPSNGGRDE